jgi:hypothetical protein
LLRTCAVGALLLGASTAQARSDDKGIIIAASVHAAASLGLGLCSWFAQDHAGGWACAIGAGHLGGGTAGGVLGWTLGMILPGRGGNYPGDARGLAAVALGLGGTVVGAIAGLIVAAVLGGTPGLQRGVVGLVSAGTAVVLTVPAAFMYRAVN